MKRDSLGAVKRAAPALKKYGAALAVMALGVALLVAPSKDDKTSEAAAVQPRGETELEARLEGVLTLIDGAGRVRVLLTPLDSGERVVASDVRRSSSDGGAAEEESTTVTVSGSAGEDAVTVRQLAPNYRGAVVVAEGADSPSVRLALTEAVSAATGLPASRVRVIKMDKNSFGG